MKKKKKETRPNLKTFKNKKPRLKDTIEKKN
jgi:hypothetical protein